MFSGKRQGCKVAFKFILISPSSFIISKQSDSTCFNPIINPIKTTVGPPAEKWPVSIHIPIRINKCNFILLFHLTHLC